MGAVVASGLLVNVYLALIARLVPDAGDYGAFGAFWSIALVVGFGAFLPVEQELARMLQTSVPSRVAVRAGVRAAAGLALVSVVTLLALLPLLHAAYDGSRGLVAATVAVAVVSTVQFLLRGLLIGTGRLRLHAGVIVLDAALRVGLVLVLVAAGADRYPSTYAWTLVTAIAVAHLPVLAVVLKDLRTQRVAAPVPDGLPWAAFGRAVGQLLVGSLFAQVLLNGPPLLVAAVATSGEQDAAGRFLAAFTLARIPLFIAVPLQSAVVPSLARLVTAGRQRDLRTLVGRICLALVGVAVVGGLVTQIAGPAVVGLVFGSRYVVPGADLALLVVGVVAHLGLLLVAQALVAAGRHGAVALTWAVAVVAAVPPAVLIADLYARAEWAFVVGSVIGWACGVWLLSTGARRTRPDHPLPAESAAEPRRNDGF